MTETGTSAPRSSPATEGVAVQRQRSTLCADCGAPIGGSYCAACGQETHIETPTVRHFLREFIDQYVALEGRLGRTLRVLAIEPGQLTLDYIEGRRQRYVRPLKLYLSISLIFFTLLGLLPDSSNPFIDDAEKDGDAPRIHFDYDKKPPKQTGGQPAHSEGKSTAKTPDGGMVDKTDSDVPGRKAGKDADDDDGEEAPQPGSLKSKIKAKADAFSHLDAAAQRRAVRRKLADDAPYAMFFLLPYFALLLRLFYRKQKLRYGVHLLFSLHLHSFLFILLALGFLPLPSLFGTAVEIVAAVYVFFALRRVYGGTLIRTLWRMFWLWAFYFVAAATTAVSGVLNAVYETAT